MRRSSVLLLLVCVIATAGGTCTFPSTLQATWSTSSNGNITLTSNTLLDYPVDSYGNFDFDCHQEYAGLYIVKSQTTISTAGLTLHVYMCFDFTYVSDNLYYYYLATNFTQSVQAIFRVTWLSPTVDEVCAQSTSQYDPALFQVMIKDGDGAAAKQPCPTDLQATWNYAIDSGSGNTCTAGSELEACEDSQMSVNYTMCSTTVFYSSSGLVYCLASLTSGSLTYLVVYNSDSSVDSSTTYRLTCLVYEVTGTTVNMTQYPDVCESGQTATNVNTPTGSIISLDNSTSCPTPPVEEVDYTLYIVLGVIAAVLLIFIAVIVLFVVLNYKAKQKRFRGKPEPEGMGEDKGSRLHAFENGFKRIKHPGELDKPGDRDGSPDHDDDTPINVMQLLRKDIITPGGRESPSSNVLLSVTTPNPYSLHDGDSLGGGSLHLPYENPSLKKHYHVIGGEPSIADLVEEDEDDNCSDVATRVVPLAPAKALQRQQLQQQPPQRPPPPRAGSGRSVKTPVMVMPVRSDGTDLFDGDGDDVSDDALFDDGEEGATLAAARQGVGLTDAMCPPTRLPPIDEGPASHRSYTGAGNHARRKRLFRSADRTAGFEDEDGYPIDGMTEDGSPLEVASCPPSKRGFPFRRHSSAEAGVLQYKTESGLVVGMPDIVEQVDMGMDTVIETQTDNTRAQENKSPAAQGARLELSTLSTKESDHSRSSSARINDIRSATAAGSAGESGRRTRSRSRRKPKYVNEDDLRPKSRVKMTRVDIPELLPPGEDEVRPRGDDELVETPKMCFHNVAFADEEKPSSGGTDRETAGPQRDRAGSTARRPWLSPDHAPADLWSTVHHMWRRSLTDKRHDASHSDATSAV